MSDALAAIVARYHLKPFSGNEDLPIDLPFGVRNDLPKLFADLGYRVGAEIGVFRGNFSARLLAANQGLSLVCVDPWAPFPDYGDYTRPELFEDAFRETMRVLAPFNATILRATSTKAAESITDHSLDFVYIDGNHSLWHVINDLTLWSKKVRIGGIIAGHDYIRLRRSLNFRVVEAVTAFTEAYDIRPWFALGRKMIRPGERRDRERSYLWVNQPEPWAHKGQRDLVRALRGDMEHNFEAMAR
jgi:hypothetical protein